jgi:hypothetical protein
MAEALGVAGSIVGIVSLGIQVSQGLLTYYRSWANQNSTKANFCHTLELLRDTICTLDRVLKEYTFQKSTIANVQKHVNHVEVALNELECQLKEVGGVKVLDEGGPATAPQETEVQDYKGSQSRMRASMKRHMQNLLHPSREKASKSTKPPDSGATAKRHLSYPFREETLKDIQKTASEACNSLDLALQILQV